MIIIIIIMNHNIIIIIKHTKYGSSSVHDIMYASDFPVCIKF